MSYALSMIMPSGMYNHNNHPTTFKKGQIPWNKGISKYDKHRSVLANLLLVKRLKHKEVSKLLGIPKSEVSKLRIKFGIREIEDWEKWDCENLSDPQRDLIVGTLLGDGYVRRGKCKYANVSISQSIESYTKWKYAILKNWCKSGIKKSRDSYVFSTITHPVFDYYFKMFYKQNKKILTKEILKLVDDLALAVWFMDDGCCCKSRYVGKAGTRTYFSYQLRTDSFSYVENVLIKKWFKIKYDITPTICVQRGNFYLSFRKLDASKLIKIIKPYMIPELLYRIGN